MIFDGEIRRGKKKQNTRPIWSGKSEKNCRFKHVYVKLLCFKVYACYWRRYFLIAKAIYTADGHKHEPRTSVTCVRKSLSFLQIVRWRVWQCKYCAMHNVISRCTRIRQSEHWDNCIIARRTSYFRIKKRRSDFYKKKTFVRVFFFFFKLEDARDSRVKLLLAIGFTVNAQYE